MTQIPPTNLGPVPPTADKGRKPAEPSKLPSIQSLNSQIRSLLTDCPSRQALFERILDICLDQFPAMVGRVDFRTGESTQSRMKHDARMAHTLAERFSEEYLGPFADSVLASSDAEPKLKCYERSGQTMTLLCAPVTNAIEQKNEGVITLMLGGGSYRPEVVLPRLDGVAATVSAVLLVKSGQAAAAQARSSGTSETVPDANAAAAIAESSALAKASQFHSTKEFGFSIVNSLCSQVKAEQVAFGVEKNGRIAVEAISGFPDFKANSPGVAIVRQAMEECLDHESFLVAQQEQLEEIPALPIHRQWSVESSNSCVCSIPLRQGEQITGVLSIRRPANRPFRKEEIAQLLQLLSPYGAAIRVVDKANRTVGTQLKTAVGESARKNLGKGAIGRKVALCALAAGLLWFLFGSLTYRPICRTRVTAADLRHFSAPFDGKLQNVYVRPGQQVTQGDVLAEFDTVDLRLELNSLVRQISSAQVEVRQAIGDGDLSVAALAKSRVDVLQTQTAAVEKRIRDAQLVAPADGTVVLSDLEQRIGQVFPQGEELLQFAPEGDWLLEIEIPDDIVSYVAAEQTGTFAAASHPTEKQSFTIQNIDGAATMIEDRNVFVATAPLETRPEWIRTGMEGTARVETVNRPVWWVAMHRVVDWARMNFWL